MLQGYVGVPLEQGLQGKWKCHCYRIFLRSESEANFRKNTNSNFAPENGWWEDDRYDRFLLGWRNLVGANFCIENLPSAYPSLMPPKK